MEITRTARFMVLMLACCLFFGLSLAAQNPNKPFVRHEWKHDVSLPARDLAAMAKPFNPTNVRILYPGPRPQPFESVAPYPDRIAQQERLPDVNTTNLLNFDGQIHDGVAPPDTNGAVGATQFVQTVNLTYAVYNKTTGAVILNATPLSSLFSGFGGLCQTGPNFSDPIVLYDRAAQRWLIGLIAFNSSFTSNFVCVAVSTSNDATGSYNRYGFSFGNSVPDYPKFSVWPDAYYLNVNIFGNSGTTFTGADPCALDRSKMLTGATATMVCFQRTAADYSFLPSDWDGATPPPAGAPATFVELFTPNTLMQQYKFHVDFVNTNNSTFTGPTNITITNWTQICPTTRACITEPSPGEALDSIGNRIMFRLAYRNFGDHETLTATHTVKPGAGSTAIAAVRWYELRAPVGGNYTVFQSGTFQNAKISLWMPAIAMDKVGDIALGMSAASSTVKPSVVYTGRTPTDPSGKMESPFVAGKGAGVQTSTFNRWGDYSSMAIDPIDDCTFWYTQEYYKTTGSFNWATRISSFKFPGCQ